MHVQEATVHSSPLGDENSDGRQDHGAEHDGMDKKLDKEFKGCFRYDTAHPWAEVVHFTDTAIHFAAVMCSIGFMDQTGRAEAGTAIGVADEDVTVPEGYVDRAITTEGIVPCVLDGRREAAVVGAARFAVRVIGWPQLQRLRGLLCEVWCGSSSFVVASTVLWISRCFFMAFLVPCWPSLHVARVRDDRLDESSVADQKGYDEEIVEEQDGSSRTRSRLHEKFW